MFYYHRIDSSEEIEVTKSNNSKECMICHSYFVIKDLDLKGIVCNSCHGLMILLLSL